MMMQTTAQSQAANECYYGRTGEEVTQLLESHAERGLSLSEISQRHKLYGLNELAVASGQPVWLRFLLQFNQALLYILIIAGATKAFLGSWTNAAVIWGVTLINAVIGFVQESKAEGAIAALAKAVTTEATVIREGKKQVVPSQNLATTAAWNGETTSAL